MGRTEIEKIYSHLLTNFVLNIFFHPVFMYIFFIIGLGLRPFLEVIGLLTLVIVPSLLIIIFIYNIFIKKLQVIINENKTDEKSLQLAVTIPKIATILLIFFLTSGSFLITLLCYHQRIILTPLQIIFFIFSGTLLAFTVALYHYYRMKIILHPITTATDLKSLEMFEKLLAPILTFMMITLLTIGISIYNLNINKTISTYKNATTLNTEKILITLDNSYKAVTGEMTSYLNLIQPEKISPADSMRQMISLYKRRVNREIETLFLIKNNGMTYNNSGTAIDLSGRSYIQEMLSAKAISWSDLILSKDTGNQVIVCAVPYLQDKKVYGALGASINLTSMTDIIKKASSEDTTKYMIMSDNGTIIYHPEKSYIGKVFGKDLRDEKGKDVNEFLRSSDSNYYEYVINGREMMIKKLKISSTGHYLVSITYLKTLMGEVNGIILKILLGLIAVVLFITIMIYRLGKSFSTPIQNTIDIFKKLSEGDLTVRSNDYLADEFGDMIKNLKRFQGRILEVINTVVVSSNQLASSAVELAATSSNLAESAQSQAAAVEEATASLEEISASNESISESSNVQSEHSKKTYKAMEELGTIVKSVNADATSALNVANETANEAKKGSDLMQNTITGMNSIEENSLKIAEMISMISDISDKVNLLALNAAIEAARAGDQGRGFAVVADEIGKLAEQTAESAKIITGLVSNGVKSAGQGKKDIDETSKALANIISYITNTKELVQKIANSTDVQAKSSEQVLKATGQVMEMSDNISNSTNEQTITHMEISKTMDQINEQTQSQASGAEQIASSAEEISAQAESMKNVLSFFKTS